jgi:hypothetical protein
MRTLRLASPLLAVLLISTAAGRNNGNSSKGPANDLPSVQIHLRDLGYRPAPEYRCPGTGIPRDLSVLFDDYKIRLTFIDEKTLVVYQSHYPPPSEGDRLPPRSMEAFFVNADSGSLVSHKTWATRKRTWFNERWDTQARILAVEGGLLVQGGDALTLYSTDLKEKAELPLEEHLSWAATVAPMGRTVHLQRIDRGRADGMADGEWLASDSLAKLRQQQEFAGVVSASDYATVDRLAHCVQLQAVGESPRSLCCFSSCLGLPLFLSNTEVLSVYRNGFDVLSTNSEKLWGREVPGSKNGLIGDHKRSLNGNRFAISLSGERRTIFDQIKIPNRHLEILVYDRSARTKVFRLDAGLVKERIGFDLSPDGSVLAVLIGDLLRLYRIP